MRGPLKPGFGLSGDVQIFSILSSRPKQIIARAVIFGVEGPAVVTSTGAEGRVKIESEWAGRKRERAEGTLCPAAEHPHSSQNRA